MYRGGKNFVYRLSVGKVPVITSLWPNGAKRGDNIVSKIDGANLGGTNSLTLQVAADTLSNRPVWLEPMIGSVPALPIAVNLTDYSQSVRSEAPGTSTVLSLDNQSVSIIGNLTKPKEVDAFVFAGQSGKPVQIQVAARGIGSRIMPFVSVVDSAGKILQTTEEEIGRDALFSFNPPANGNFTINISTIDGKFGPDYNYRLTLRPQGGNDFRLSTTPDLLNLGKGQTAIVTVNVDRKDGYGGPVEVSLKGVPTGITATPLVIPAGAASGVFTVTSAPEANGISGFLQIVGVG